MSAKLLKRKLKSGVPASRKKVKTEHLSASDLPWKLVKSRQEAGLLSDLDGMMELEEVDNVEVFYEQGASVRVAKFKVGQSTVMRILYTE